jgi:hypothetical protein
LVLERLTAHAIDPDVKPAQRLRALELLGKVTEVAAFTERRELIKVTDSSQARTKLIQTLRDAMRAGAIDATILEPLVVTEPVTLEAEPEPSAGDDPAPS